MTTAIRIMVVDGHTLMRDALGRLIESQADMRLVGCAVTLEEAIDVHGRERPDVTIVGVRAPDIDALRGVRRLLESCPEARVLVVSAHGDPLGADQAANAGARGFLLKTDVRRDLLALIREVRRSA